MADPTAEMAVPRGHDEYTREQFYNPELVLPSSTRDLLVDYGKIPVNQVDSHVRDIRDKAWAVHHYPCIGEWRFLDLAVGNHALYKRELLPRMLSGEQTYLDLGCAFAQNIRRLVADGVDSSECFGADLRLEFIEFGYELFNDRETLKSRFIAADIFDAGSPLKDLEGKIDIVEASSFFHLFTWDEQKEVARNVVKLMKPQKDSLVVGRQAGSENAGEFTRRSGQGSRYRHNLESWKRMWTEVGNEVGVKFEVEGRTVPLEHVIARIRPEDKGGMMMEFSVRRLG